MGILAGICNINHISFLHVLKDRFLEQCKNLNVPCTFFEIAKQPQGDSTVIVVTMLGWMDSSLPVFEHP
jgi:hypothetical protein